MKASLTPRERYARALEDPDFVADAAQETAIEALQGIYLQLIARPASLSPWQRWRNTLSRDREIAPVKGLYLWGGVGRGKTHLMDMFFRALPFRQKTKTPLSPLHVRIVRTAKKQETNNPGTPRQVFCDLFDGVLLLFPVF